MNKPKKKKKKYDDLFLVLFYISHYFATIDDCYKAIIDSCGKTGKETRGRKERTTQLEIV